MIETGAMMGAEESGGFGFGMHLPERDGVYADLLLLDLFLRERAAGRWPVSSAIEHFHELAGPSFYRRIDVHVERAAYPETKRRLLVDLREQAPAELAGAAGRADRARSTRTTASSSSSADGSWLLVRASGTEPLVRVYTEATSADDPRRDARRRRAPGARLMTRRGDRRDGRGGSTSRGATSSSGPTRTATSARSSSSRPASGCRSSATRSRTSRSSCCPAGCELYLEDDAGDGPASRSSGRATHRHVADRPDPPLRGHRALRADRGLDAGARRRRPARGRLRARGDERARRSVRAVRGTMIRGVPAAAGGCTLRSTRPPSPVEVHDRTAAPRAPTGDGGSSAMHSSLIGKVEKANRYARELDRITIDRLSLTFRGDNDTHHVSLDAGQWRCTCHYFESWASCVHLLTLQKVFGRDAARGGPGLDLLGLPGAGGHDRLTTAGAGGQDTSSRQNAGRAAELAERDRHGERPRPGAPAPRPAARPGPAADLDRPVPSALVAGASTRRPVGHGDGPVDRLTVSSSPVRRRRSGRPAATGCRIRRRPRRTSRADPRPDRRRRPAATASGGVSTPAPPAVGVAVEVGATDGVGSGATALGGAVAAVSVSSGVGGVDDEPVHAPARTAMSANVAARPVDPGPGISHLRRSADTARPCRGRRR